MAIVERLYGVTQAAVAQLGNQEIGVLSVSPSHDLVKDLLMLPINTRVGIEFTPEIAQQSEADEAQHEKAVKANFYWDRVTRLARKKGLELIHLDSTNTYRKLLGITSRMALFETQLETTEDEDVAIQLQRELYKARVEGEYALEVEREDEILERINQTQPQVVILGRGHGDYFAQRKTQIRAKGVEIKQYIAEKALGEDSLNAVPFWKNPLPYERSYIDSSHIPDPTIALERTLLERNYRAVTQGRVTDERTPAYIGTWSLVVPAEGLFEVYIGKGYSFGAGVVEDVVGSAIIRGEIGDTYARFTKTYLPDISSQDVFKSALEHAGRMQPNGIFEGEWTTGRFAMPFRMARYTPGMDINTVLGY